MTRILIFLLAVGVIYCAMGVTMNNALRNQVVTDFKNAIIPVISKKFSTVVVPDVHTKEHGFKIDITRIIVHVNPINPAQIAISFAAPATINFSGSSFGMSGTAHIHAKWKIIKKSMNLKMSISNVGFSTAIELTAVNGKPNIAIRKLDISVSSHHISIKLSGGLIAKIVQFIIKLFKGKIVSSVVNNLKKAIPNEITNKVNHILNSLPSDIRVAPSIMMKYNFPTRPTVELGFLFTGIVAYLHPQNDPNPPICIPKPMPKIVTKDMKGIQFIVSDCIITTALDTAQKLNLMYIAVNKRIDDRQVSMQCRTTKSPNFSFKPNLITVLGDSGCDVSIVKGQTKKLTVNLQVDLRLSEHVKNAVIFFRGDTLKFTKMEFKAGEPVDIEWFKKAVNQIIAAVLEVINGELGRRGIPLPTMNEVNYSDFVQYIENGYTTLGTTPSFHFKMDEESSLEVITTEPIEINPDESDELEIK